MLLASLAGASLVGTRLYQSQRSADAELHPATAILSQSARGSKLTPTWDVLARWPASDGRERSGLLTAVNVAGDVSTAAGTRVPIWLNRDNEPAGPPSGQVIIITSALLAAIITAGGAALDQPPLNAHPEKAADRATELNRPLLSRIGGR